MKNFDLAATELAIELGMRVARGWHATHHALRAEYGFSRATAYRWAKRMRDAQRKVAAQQEASTRRKAA